MKRPPKLTDERWAKIVDCVAEGNYRETAAALVGVCRGTVARWYDAGIVELEEAQRLEDEGGKAPDLSAVALFAEQVMAAEAKGEVEFVRRMKRGDENKHLQFFLARRYPKRWGKAAERVDLHVSGELDVRDPRETLLSRLSAVLDGGPAEAGDPKSEPGRR